MTARTRGLKDPLWAIALAGLVAGILRMWFGLGATTNLTDQVPWGLWKILNMVGGVAISTSGFTVGFLVYVLGLERFRPLMKPAILVAFLGYGCSCAALMFDIGLPWRFWHPFVMWNEHSFLFEVFWCVIIYFTITAIELAPTVFEELKAERAAKFLHRISFGVVVVGISLSSLHHSSLGSLFLVTPQRLHPLWYTPLLPVLFILSAMGAGMMFVVLVRILHARWYDPEVVFGPPRLEQELCLIRSEGKVDLPPTRVTGPAMPRLVGLASIATGILGVYGLVQMVALSSGGGWEALGAGSWESWLYGVEICLSTLLPILLVWLPGTRGSPVALGIAALSASVGLGLNRMDVGIFGYFRDAGVVYFPSLVEWAVSLGVVAAAALLFLYFAENMGVFADSRGGHGEDRPFGASFDSLTHVWQSALQSGLERATIIGVLVIPLAFVLMYPPFHEDQVPLIEPAAGMDVERVSLRIDGNRGGVVAIFPHDEHKERLGGESSCQSCHHLSLPGDETTPCSRCHTHMVEPTQIFDHDRHQTMVAEADELQGVFPENQSCVQCHTAGQAKTAENAKGCLECHGEDSGWESVDESTADLARAVSYMEAMHGTCIQCHKEEGSKMDRADLQDCSACHSSLDSRPTDLRVAGSGR